MNEYIKYFDNLDQAEGYEIKDIPFSGYVKDSHLALLSKRWGDIKEGEVSYARYLFYTTNDGSTIELNNSSEFPELMRNEYRDGEGAMRFSDSVTSIGNKAFYNCPSLTSVTIPDSMMSIEQYAFSNCSSLTSVTIPDSMMSIEQYAFSNCSSLTSIALPNGVTSIEKATFRGCSSLTSVTIPDGVSSIKNWAFENCTSLTSIVIPSSVTSIGERTFYDCSSLTSITIPNSVTSIGYTAFYNTGIFNDNSNWENGVLYISNCLVDAKESLSGAYTIKNGTRIIADVAFSNCPSLTSITIPNSVTNIGGQICSGCTSLISITCEATTPPILDSSFYVLYNVTAVYVPADSVEAYKTATNWSLYSGVIQPI